MLPLTLKNDGDALYAAQEKVYPREIDGRYQRLRRLAAFWLLGMFYVFPWLAWDGRQAVLFDLPQRKFYIFGLTFWPQDFYLLALLLIGAALTLFVSTALAGRLWCGYACPQTVWTEVYLWVERRIEGDRNRRMKLDAAPWTRDKLLRKTAKQVAWIVLSLWTGFTFVGFFTPIRPLAHDVLAFAPGGWALFWMLFYALATYGNAGYLREQVCKYMCPYARFQGAMFDRDTLVITYDAARGEPRGGRRRGADPKALALGDCVDCTACVQVCPTGIDIRNGLQYECIACAACIDACDAVMDRMAYRRGLVRYTTENALAGKPTRVLRPRVLVYAALLATLLGAVAATVALRAPVLADVVHDRNALYRETSHGDIENTYSLRLVNKTHAPLRVRLVLATTLPLRIGGADSVELGADEVENVALVLRADGGSVRGRNRLELGVQDADGRVLATASTRFFAPEAP